MHLSPSLSPNSSSWSLTGITTARSSEARGAGRRGLAGDGEVEGEHHHVRARPGDSSAGPEAALGGATTMTVRGLSAMASCSGALVTGRQGSGALDS
jgi:hypothetical protein